MVKIRSGESAENRVYAWDRLYKKMKIGEQAIYLARLKGLSSSDALS
jgi:ABC-type uncharacterized transport system ATPase subunit